MDKQQWPLSPIMNPDFYSQSLNYQLLRRPSVVLEEQIERFSGMSSNPKRLKDMKLGDSRYLDLDGKWCTMECYVEEAVLAIGSATDATSFRETALNALHVCLCGVKHALVFLLHLETQELVQYKTEDSYKPLPKSGVLWNAVRRRLACVLHPSDEILESDPIWQLLPDMKPLQEEQVLMINPVVNKTDNSVIALMMAVAADLSVLQLEKMRWITKNVLVAGTRVLKQMTAERERSRAESMLQVCSDLIDLDSTWLTTRILKHIKAALKVEMVFLFLVEDNTQELVCPCQNDEVLENEVRIEATAESIFGRCFLNGELLNLEDVPKDARFNPATDVINGYEPTNMLCLPIKSFMTSTIKRMFSSPLRSMSSTTEQILGVAVACNKLDGTVFCKRDEDNMEFILKFTSSVIANTLAFHRELTLKKQNLALLQVTRNLFSNLRDLNVLLSEIMNEARNLTNAERCSLFLLGPSKQELVATVFDGSLLSESETIRIKVGQGIAGLVAQTGNFVNIKDAYKNPQFFQDVDKNTGFHTRNLLCFPIKDHHGQVVGVAELINKQNGKFFTKYDEELATTFSVYCGISLYQCRLYEKMELSQGRSTVATELMIYHMQVFSEDIDQLASAPIPPCATFDGNYSKFFYSPRAIPEDDTVMAVVSMMEEMNLIKAWKIERRTLAKFVLMVKKGYRDPAYHNWRHALSVAHFSYLLYRQCEQLPLLSELEILALFVSCLAHDIDHRGTNNAFQVSSKSTLAALYSSVGSVMERHHFAQTVCILNSESCNIFENVSRSEYKQLLDLIQHNILSTDIQHHLRIMKDAEAMVTGGYDIGNSNHHKLLSSIIMTCSDLSSGTKEWVWSKRISDLVYTEFFTQGDMEKTLGKTPSDMMDRNKARIPEQQINFLDHISGPAYQLLKQVLPGSSSAYDNLLANREQWEAMSKQGQ